MKKRGKSFAATELELMENDLVLPLQIDRKRLNRLIGTDPV